MGNQTDIWRDLPRSKECPKCDATHCFYCDMPLARRHEHDHMPIPKAFGGKALVSACMNCHELKDRSTVELWPIISVFDGWKALPPIGRILFAKLIAVGFKAGAFEDG